MRSGLSIGDISEISITVDESMRASLMGKPIHPLYGTSAMIEHMEWAARQHILPYLEPGEDGVGHHIDVKHLAPAPLGAEIKIHSTVCDIQPRRISSTVEAWWQQTLIGSGTIVQALVRLDSFYPKQPDPNPTTEETTDTIPPASLIASNGLDRFQFEILRWETSPFGCTRYDEWLICRMDIKIQESQLRYEGAFMLRYEIEEWLDTMRAMTQNQRSSYHSDFLEPVLNIQIAEGEVTEWVCRFQANIPEQASTIVSMIVTSPALEQFCQELTAQLDGFPSHL